MRYYIVWILLIIVIIGWPLYLKDKQIKDTVKLCNSGYVCGECANDVTRLYYGYKGCWVDENYKDIIK